MATHGPGSGGPTPTPTPTPTPGGTRTSPVPPPPTSGTGAKPLPLPEGFKPGQKGVADSYKNVDTWGLFKYAMTLPKSCGINPTIPTENAGRVVTGGQAFMYNALVRGVRLACVGAMCGAFVTLLPVSPLLGIPAIFAAGAVLQQTMKINLRSPNAYTMKDIEKTHATNVSEGIRAVTALFRTERGNSEVVSPVTERKLMAIKQVLDRLVDPTRRPQDPLKDGEWEGCVKYLRDNVGKHRGWLSRLLVRE